MQRGPSALAVARVDARARVAEHSDDPRVSSPRREVKRGDLPAPGPAIYVRAGRGVDEGARGFDLTGGASARGVSQRSLGVRRHPGGRLAFNRAGVGCSCRSDDTIDLQPREIKT